jgi:hypothetical protein
MTADSESAGPERRSFPDHAGRWVGDRGRAA